MGTRRLSSLALNSATRFNPSVSSIYPYNVIKEGTNFIRSPMIASANKLKESDSTRSTNATVHNLSRKSFFLTGVSCKSGGFKSSLLNDQYLEAKSNSAFGMESREKEGIEGSVTYCNGFSWVTLFNNNPLVGDKQVTASSSSDLIVDSDVDSKNNRITYVIRDNC